MAIPILIIGKSGSGKSTSLRNCNKDEVGVINVLGKPLPFRSKLATYATDNYDVIKKALLKTSMKCMVIDDAGYLMTNQFMLGHSSTGAGNGVFSFYNDIADRFWGLIAFVVKELPPDMLVYIIMHEDKNDFGDIKPKSIGKMLDEKVCIEGMFTIVLRSVIENGEYKFKTQTDGKDVCKAPMGMFEDKYIDNDLNYTYKIIRQYYKFDSESEEK